MDQNQNTEYIPYPQPQNSYGDWQPPAPPEPSEPPESPEKKKRSKAPLLIAIVAVVLIAGGVLFGWAVVRQMNQPAPAPPVTSNDADDRELLQLAETPDSDRSVSGVEGGMTSVEIHESLRRSNVAVQIHGARGNAVVGEGSGIIIHENAAGTHTYVVTCAHVIERQQRVTIELYDGQSFPADVVGYDVRTDIGLLRVQAAGLHAATFGDSTQLRVGEPVYAIGNPGGIQFMGSFTQGIVSAIDRPIRNRHTMITIQHTAPISPGNSGGALVNSLGQVIGINSQKIVDLHFEGMGFAIPSATVQEVVNTLIATGHGPNRARLGINFIPATQTSPGSFVVRANNLPSGSLIIASIDPASGFVGTDVEPNDIITHVNDLPITRPEVLLEIVETGTVGQELNLRIVRVNQTDFSIETFNVTVPLVEDQGSAVQEEEPTSRPWFEDF